VLELILAVFVDELLVVGDNRFGDGLTDGVDLGCVSTTGNSDADIDVGELVETNDQERLVNLESQDLGLDEIKRLSVDLHESLSGLHPSCQYLFFAVYRRFARTLQCATAVAVKNLVRTSLLLSQIQQSLPVFFFPKHWTLCVEAILNDCLRGIKILRSAAHKILCALRSRRSARSERLAINTLAQIAASLT